MRKEKEYKGLVAFDLDHTLLDHTLWRITPSALRGIRRLQENGMLTVLASGRNMHDRHSQQYLDEIQPDALVHMNGTVVELRETEEEGSPPGKDGKRSKKSGEAEKNWTSGEILLDHRMDRELLRRILDFCTENGCAIGASIEDRDYYTCTWDVVRHDLEFWGSSERNFQEPYGLLEEIVRSMAFCGSRERAELIKAAFPELEVLMFSRETGADVFEKGHSKLDGLQVLAKYYGIDWEKSYAFGDSFNDLAMLKGVRHGIAVGNAVEEIRRCADYVTDQIDRDGVWNALQHFGLL